MSSATIQSPESPDLRALLDSFKAELFSSFNCHKVGTIVAFNKDAGPTASVQISSLVQVNGRQIAYPVLADCPVVVLGGGGGSIQFPIKVGDPCLVLFHDTDLDKWFTTGNSVVPNTPRTHSLSDGLVLVGIQNLANPISGYSLYDLQIKYGGASIGLTSTGDINLVSPVGKTITLITGTGGIIQINNKLRLGNAATDLSAAVTDLITALKAWVNTGGSTPNAATIAALNTVQTEFNSLLA